jgi:transcriptional regulator with XRE-family HTH domain
VPNTRKKTYSPYSKEAVLLLGKKIKLARIQKSWSEKELAERANVSRETIQRAEKGTPSCAIGTMFELAFLVGIKLFDSELPSIQSQHASIDNQIALLPSRIRNTSMKRVQDDDF